MVDRNEEIGKLWAQVWFDRLQQAVKRIYAKPPDVPDIGSATVQCEIEPGKVRSTVVGVRGPDDSHRVVLELRLRDIFSDKLLEMMPPYAVLAVMYAGKSGASQLRHLNVSGLLERYNIRASCTCMKGSLVCGHVRALWQHIEGKITVKPVILLDMCGFTRDDWFDLAMERVGSGSPVRPRYQDVAHSLRDGQGAEGARQPDGAAWEREDTPRRQIRQRRLAPESFWNGVPDDWAKPFYLEQAGDLAAAWIFEAPPILRADGEYHRFTQFMTDIYDQIGFAMRKVGEGGTRHAFTSGDDGDSL